MYFKTQEDYAKWLEQQEPNAVGGGILSPHGVKDYVGAVMALRAVLYFKEGYSLEMREAISQCYEDYTAIAQEYLTWLWQEEAPDGEKDLIHYQDAKPIRKILKSYSEDKALNLLCTSGKQKYATGAWEFNVGVHSKWENEVRYKPSILTFSMPIEWVKANSKAFIQLFRDCAKLLKAIHGYAGYACVLSQIRTEDNEPTEAYYSRQYWAMDIGNPYSLSNELKTGIKTVNWLTAINYEWLNPLLEQEDFNSELPCSWFVGYDYGEGMVIQAGRLPDTGQVDIDARPAPYVLLNRLLKPLRVKEIGSVHSGSYSTQENPLIKGYRADAWLTRFDIEDKEKLDYFGKLIKAPKLTEDYAFLDDRVDWRL